MLLAPYASDPTKSVGRIYDEKFESSRNPFLKDRERVINSVAFRRLEYKTQVFVNHMGDHYRTRLTHSLEVSHIARVIARDLGLNEELAETIALCHDLGHPPFGHSGEDGLDAAAKEYGGFDHNMQTVKIITSLEQRYAEFDGLNLTWEAIEGTIKHNGPLKKDEALHPVIANLNSKIDLKLYQYSSLEAQVAGFADDIAYCNHDIDDGIRAGMFKLEDLKCIPIAYEIYQSVIAVYPDVSETRIVSEFNRRLLRFMVNDLIFETRKNIDTMKIKVASDARERDRMTVVFSNEVAKMKDDLKTFLMENVYRNYRVNRMAIKANKIMFDLFNTFIQQPNSLPTDWYKKVMEAEHPNQKAEHIIDYISGMTDRYAIEEHKRLFDLAIL